MKPFQVLLVIFSFLISTVVAQEDCKLKKDENGILVYACKSETEKFKSLKAEFTINNTSISELVAFLKNVPNYPKWQYNMMDAKMIKNESEEVMIVRSEIDAPWPVENRELIVQYQLTLNEKGDELHIVAKTIPSDYPRSKDFIRVPFSHAEWMVSKSGNGLKVSYRMRIDPGGSVPAWVVNMAVAEGPFHTFTNLKKELE